MAPAAVETNVELNCCTRFGAPQKVGVTPRELHELSGLVASRTQPGIFWAHNDSGDSARFFALQLDGTIVQTFTVANATNVDWEDVGLGPCPTGTCLFFGDIGDNSKLRAQSLIYRVPEPTVGGPSTVSADAFGFTWPDGPHNAEALFVAPSGVLYLFTKEPAGPSDVFRLSMQEPLEVAEHVAKLAFPRDIDAPITGAAISPCGDVVAVRMYNRLVKLTVPPGQPFEAVFAESPVDLSTPNELQSEAVTFAADGRSIITTSEQLFGMPVPLWQSTCR